MTARNSCGICTGDPARRSLVNRQLAAGTAPARIENIAREAGLPVKRETITKHRDNCLGGREVPPETKRQMAQVAVTGSTEDFAVLVKSEAVRRMQEGELRVDVKDGLAAQALLDRRAEKQKDRELAAAIGKLLAGGSGSGAMLSAPPIIEGEFTELEPGELVQIGSGD